tara:strand:+ start:515 stop:904 length:390 start_codon:yes stop_codon:yes gene_type:complete
MAYELKEYLNSINSTKQNIMDGEDEGYEKKYPAFIINKCLAPHNDCLMLVNEMNHYSFLDKKLQYDFLLNTIVSRKRYASWLRPSKTKNLEYVKEYYGYSNSKSKSVLDILNDEQIEFIKTKLYKGGQK